MKDLAGKTAVVTGAASGMGQAFCERFARAGMRIVMVDVEAPALEAAAAALRSSGADVVARVCDVTDPDANDAVLAATVEAFGQANLVCLNAGVGGNPPMASEWVHLPSWKWVMDVNFWGVVNGFRTFLPHLSEHGDGHIVTTASMAGLLPGFSAYNASKFAVTGITEGLYNQLQARRSPLGVSCLCPGFVATNIMTSTRNRPEWAALPRDAAPPDPEVEVRMAAVGDRIAGGKPPAEVADLVHDAVVEGRFWIFTDDEFLPYAAERHRSIEAATNPELWRRSAV